MIQRISKRFLSLLLVAVMVLAFVPAITLPAFAATSGTVTGLSDSNIGLSFSGTADDAWSATGTQIIGKARSTSGAGCGELAVTPEALNAVLPEGVRVLEVYESTRKARELRRLRALLTLEYDGAVPEPAAITALLEQPELVVEKRTKRGMAETDIRPMLHAFHVETAPGALLLTCEVSAQEPSLNPMLLAAAIERYLPEAKPDFVRCRRLEMLDEQGGIFR